MVRHAKARLCRQSDIPLIQLIIRWASTKSVSTYPGFAVLQSHDDSDQQIHDLPKSARKPYDNDNGSLA
jgi:hypothetical protein